MPTDRARPNIIVDVPPEFAAEFLIEDLKKEADARKHFTLSLGDVDLGLYRVLAVGTETAWGGYQVATAVLQPAWE